MDALSQLYKLVETQAVELAAVKDPALVKQLQTMLVSAGYPLAIDGIMGQKTLAAFAEFKVSEYLEAPRLLGKTALDALKVEAAEATRSKPYNVEEATPQVYKGRVVKIAGYGGKHTDEPIIKGGSFTWGEATHEGTRPPESQEVSQNIINLATHLEGARKKIGKPLRVTSWYRPPAINRKVGGASRSQHLYGKAVDIVVNGENGRSMAAKLTGWPGGMGIYADRPMILHLDIGAKRRWNGCPW